MNALFKPTLRSLAQPRGLRAAFVSILTCLFGLSIAFAQTQTGATGTIRGRVVNQATGDYLRNAIVTIAGTETSVTAEAGGTFVLGNVPAGEVQLVANYTGLDPTTVTVNVPPGGTIETEISLNSGVYENDIYKMGKYVVSTEREGNAKAIMEQRGAINMKKVIASDVFGDVTEGNVGEFLKLMPGVTVDYVEADVRTIRVRGFNPKYARVLMDGSPIANAGSSDINTGRAFEFEQLSINSIETVELSKAPTPDQPSAVAGVVNLRSRGAFDRKGRRIEYQASAALNEYYFHAKEDYIYDDDKHSGLSPNAMLKYSDVLFGKLGIQIGASFSNTLTAQKHIRISYAHDGDPSNNDSEIPRITGFNYRDGPKPTKRQNYNLRLDYKVTPQLRLMARADVNMYDAAFFNRDLNINALGGTGAANSVYNAPGGTLKDPNVEYSLNSQTYVAGSTASTSGGTNNKFGETITFATGADYSGTNLRIEPQLVYSKATNRYENLTRGYFDGYGANLSNVNWRFNRSSPTSTDVTFTQLSGPDWWDLSNYTLNGATETRRRGKDQQYSGKVDFTYLLRNAPIPLRLKFGGSSNLMVRDVQRLNGIPYVFRGADGVVGTADDNPGQFLERGLRTDFGHGGNVNGRPHVSTWLLAKMYEAHPEWWLLPTGSALNELVTRNSWDFEERIDSVYLQLRGEYRRWDIAPGIRYEHTDVKGRGPFDFGNSRARQKLGLGLLDPIPDINAYIAARYGQESGANKFGNTLFYVHSNYRFTDNLVLRGSYHTAVTRADPGNLVSSYSINETNQTVTSNNPELRPELARVINLGLEYYWEPSSYASFYVFRQDIEDLQLRVGNQRIGPEGYDDDPSLAGFLLNRWENVAKAHTTGFEADFSQQLSFLPGAWRGLGVFANYTHLRFDTWYNFPGSARHQGSGGLSYRFGRFYGQFRGTFTGQRQQTGGARPTSGLVNWDKERLMFDLNMEYDLAKGIRLFMTARNITNEPTVSYINKEEWFTRAADFGSIWTFGVKGTF
jgi:iron complex outermembrane recepter protein